MQRLIQTLFTALLFSTGSIFAQSAPVTDYTGTEVRLAAPPVRVVSLLPSSTETLIALGQGGLLVGIDEDSPQPAGAALPVLGSAFAPNIELIIELEPDLVLADQFSGVHEQLNELGVPTFAGMPGNVSEILEFNTSLGLLLGSEEEAAGLNARLTAGLEELASRTADLDGPAVYVELDPTPFAAGPGSYIDDLLKAVGASNVVPEELGAWPMLSPEFVVASEPDVVLLLDAPFGETTETFLARPGFSGITAQVIEVDAATGDLLSRAGPGMIEAAEWLFSVLYGPDDE